MAARQRIVLAYSGAIENSSAIPRLERHYKADVVTLTIDVGQGNELEEIRDRALAAGAVRAHVLDAREEFARDFIMPALKADAVSGDGSPLAVPLSRPILAQKLVEIAALEDARAVAHGCVPGSGDAAALETAIRARSPQLGVVNAREISAAASQKLDYARKGVVAMAGVRESVYRIGGNLWGRSIESDVLDDPWKHPPEELYAITKSPAQCPGEAASVELTFEHGVPTSINGVPMLFLDLIASLNTIAGAHGVGRIDALDRAPDGTTARRIYEAPAAVVLHAAHRDLQQLVTPPDLEPFRLTVSVQYADVIRRGLWFSALREALDAFVAKVQEAVVGTVRLKLFKGTCRVIGRKSPLASSGRALEMAGKRVDH